MSSAIKATNFELFGQTNRYQGKVRDVYTVKELLIMVATDRISAFDVVLPEAIPHKGQVLNQVAVRALEATNDIVPNWMLDSPDPNVTIGINCDTFPVEMVIRGYLAGHAWREYNLGKREVCGVALPDGLKENDKLPSPIITPTTKAAVGHDEDISKEEILSKHLVSAEHYERLESYTRKLFDRGTEMASRQGLILVDTKYEFGLHKDQIILIDEIHTPDSSRYFYADTYEELQQKGEKQRQLSKEFVRQWLIENGFQGKAGQQVPEMTDEIVEHISNRYIELYEKVTGEKFVRDESENKADRIRMNIEKTLSKY